MKKLVSTLAMSTVLAVTSAFVGTAATAQTFPDRPITLVVSYTPGGGTDTIARKFADQVSRDSGQQVIVDNRPGANGNVGTSVVAEAEPDGYTILLASFGPMSVNPSMYATMPHVPSETLDPVTQLASTPLAIIAHESVGVETMQELAEKARANPGQLTYGSGGTGTSSHLGGELFDLTAGIETRHIPYRGAAQAMTAVLSGELQYYVVPLPSVLPHVETGRIKVLAVTGAERAKPLPDVPTVAEAGFPELEMTTWYGIAVPKGTPRDVVDALNAMFVNAAKSEDMVAWLEGDGGANPVGSSPEGFGAFLASESVKWAEVVKAANITIE